MFFGLTCLGPQNPFQSQSLRAVNLAQVPADRLRPAFDAVRRSYRLSVDGRLPVNYDAIRRLLCIVYGLEPSPAEIDLLLQHLHGSADIDSNDWEAAVEHVQGQARQIAESSLVEYQSQKALAADRYRNRRPRFAPQHRFRAPILTSQQTGWHKPGPDEVVKRKPNITCPETKFACEMVRAGVIF